MKRMGFVRFFYIIFLLLTASFYYCGAKSENEPQNNVPGGALEMSAGSAYQGTFYSESGRDIDYYYIAVDPSKMVSGYLEGVKGVDSEILIMRKGDTHPFKIANDNGSSLGESFGPIRIREQGLLLAIRARQTINDVEYEELPYKFVVNVENAPEFLEIEPNDSFEQAQTIENSNIRGYYSSVYSMHKTKERDFYAVNLTEKIRYRLSASLSPVHGIDAELQVYSADKVTLIDVDAKGAGEGEDLPSYGVMGPGLVYISVSAKDGDMSGHDYYELNVSTVEYEDKYEFEPNDTIDKATPLKASEIFGDFINPDDNDYYYFYNQSSEPRQFTMEVVPEANIDIVLQLYINKTNSFIEFNDSAGGSEAIVQWTLQPLQNAYVRVSASKLDINSPRGYTVNWISSELQPGWEIENNGSKNTATELQPNNSMRGYLNPVSDKDYYAVKIPSQGNYKITIEDFNGCPVSLAAADKNGYKTDGASATGDSGTLSLNAILEPGGFIIVSCSTDTVADGAALYKSAYKLTYSPQ